MFSLEVLMLNLVVPLPQKTNRHPSLLLSGLCVRRDARSADAHPCAALRPPPDQDGVCERDGPVLWLERAQGALYAAAQQRPALVHLAPGRHPVRHTEHARSVGS